MGARTDEAAQRVAAQRWRISSMLDDLDHRVQEDVQRVRATTEERVSDMTDRATHLHQKVPGGEQLEAQVSSHPLTSVLGGFGAGVALGMATGGSSDPDAGEHRNGTGPRYREGRSGRNGGGAFDMINAFAMSSIAGPVRDEVQTLFGQVVSGLMGKEDRRPQPDDTTRISEAQHSS